MKFEINIDEKFLLSQSNVRLASFSRMLDEFKHKATMLKRESKTRLPTFVLDNKLVGYEFAKACSVPTPKILQAGVPLSDIKFMPSTVIKPMYENSSKGVFIAYSNDNITYLNKRKRYTQYSEAKKHAENLLETQIVKVDQWMVEELILNNTNIARDLKFYCFYGKTGLILETTREQGVKRCWFDGDLNYVNTGKYETNPFKGSRESIREIQTIAEALSLEIPAPFVRIDFLVCEQEYYLGEFTPLPGNYAGFNSEWDAYLGKLYLDATTQICCDVAHGKIFNNYINLPKTELEVISILKRHP